MDFIAHIYTSGIRIRVLFKTGIKWILTPSRIKLSSFMGKAAFGSGTLMELGESWCQTLFTKAIQGP